MVTADEIQAGLLMHARWKRRLGDAIKTQQSEFQPAVVSRADRCEFASWLESLPFDDQATAQYQEIKQLHAEFHKTAGSILKLALDGRAEEATRELGVGGSYPTASGRLVLALQKWPTT